VIDCDSTLEANALQRMLEPFEDPAVGGVGGSVLARNAWASNVASVQALEYLFSIYLGRALLDYFNLFGCISGALGAFRREAWEAVGGMDVGPGEDFDMTLRLRQHGYQVRFVASATCCTDVPETWTDLVRQRMRWERDAYRIRARKHGFILNPFDRRFRLQEAVHQLDFYIFEFWAAIFFIVYLTFLTTYAPTLAPTLLLATGLVLLALDCVTLLLALIMTERHSYLTLFMYTPLFVLFQAAMRIIRLFAYLEEMIFVASRFDDYVPAKVRARAYQR
jgi:cellulose synthase/poly-beta-1,6-N-acetylglucosamine synthase-like glycosyltransferase